MMIDRTGKERTVTYFTLLSTTGTLVCCALPIIFVTLGLGATVAAVTSTFPFLITLSLYKEWVFGFAALMLVLSGWLLFRSGRTCPSNSVLAAKCDRITKWNKRIYWTCLVIFGIGVFVAYLLLPLRMWLEG